MNRVREYRLQAKLTQAELGRHAGIDSRTVSKAEEGQAVREVQASAIAQALSDALSMELTVQDLGITVYQ